MAYGNRPYSGAPYSSSGSVPVDVAGVAGGLELDGKIGTAAAGVEVAGVAGGLTLTGLVGTVVAGVAAVIAGVAGAIVIAGTIGTVQAGTAVNVSGTPGAIEITGTVGTVVVGHDITGTPGAMELAGQIGTVAAGTAANVAGVAGGLELSGQIGAVETGAGVNVAGVAGSLELTGQTGTIVTGNEIAGTAGALELTGTIGTVSTGGAVDIAGVTGALELTGQTGTVVANTAAIVAGVTGGLELTGTVGTVSAGTAVNIAGVAGALELSGQVGTVAAGNAIPGVLGGLEFSGKVGAFSTGGGVNVTGVTGGLRLTGTVGTITATAPHYFLRPAPGDLDALVEATHTDVVGIFEVYVYRTSLGASEWVRWSTVPLTTEPDDSLPNYEFDDRVMDFGLSSNLWASDDARGIILGESRANTAEVTLDNADGELDALFNPGLDGVREYHWRRRPARFRIGHSSWGYDDYVVVWAGHVDEAQSDGQTATMQLRDILERLDSPVNETVYEGTAWIGESASSVAIGTGSKSFVLPNLVTNGDFPTNLSGWTAGTGWAQSSGTATKSAGTASTLAQDNLVTAADNLYRLRATLTRSAGTITVTVDGAPLADATFSAAGTIDVTFTAAGSATDIAFSADAAFAGTLDDITVRQEPEAEAGDMANIARTSALSTSWMWGEVASWTPATGTLVVTVATVGGSGTFSDWSIWLRGDEGGPDMAGKPVPDPLGIVRRMEPDYLGSVQGHILYRGAIGVWDVAVAYDGGASIALSGSFPPAAGEVYVDGDRGLAWVANDVTPDLPFTVDCVAGSGTYTARRVWSQPGSYSLVIPSGVTSIRFKGWAGGGGGGAGTGKGGGGAFVDTTIAVTPGESLLVVIGGAGRFPSASYPTFGTFFAPGGPSALGPGGIGAGSAGAGVAATEWGGGGGGASGLKRGATRIVVIGGGGGAAKNRNGGGGGGDGGSGAARDGKAGEDTVGGDGGQTTTDGVTGVDGQAGDIELVSGEGPGRGGFGQGGGGGGLHGGGGGASDTIEGAGAGGGGSSEDAGGTTENGSSDTPGGDTDGDWDGIAGTGGAAGADGKDGRVVISWSQTLAGLDPTAGNLLRDVLRDRRGYRLIEVDQSTLVSVEADAETRTFTFGASIAALGVAELDVFSLAGTAANADALFTVQSATSTTITVKEPVVDMGSDTAFTLTLGEVDGTALGDIDAITDAMGHVLREPGETGRQVTDKILGSLGWFLDVTRHGIVTAGPFGPPADTADHTIDEAAEGSIFEIVREPAAPALWRVKAGAERCYRVHSKPEIATSAADADRRFVLSEWRENPPALGTAADVRTKDLAAVETFIPTLFAYRASLNTRVPEWLSWFTPDRQAYRITLGPRAWAIRQGETVAVKAPSIGITDYVNMVVIGRDISHADMTGRLIVWR